MVFDFDFDEPEQLPRYFEVTFKERDICGQKEVTVLLNDLVQVGDKINDNSYNEDFYRYHDIFHYSFAATLGWSPCTRAMMKKKRKSNPLIDKIEDGAKATITEEAISLIIFNEAKRNNFFETKGVSENTLRLIKEMTDGFEVKIKTIKEWEYTISKAYEMFRLLVKNKGGKVKFNLVSKNIQFAVC